MAKVTVMFGAEPQSEHTLTKDQMRVGRAPDCDIVIDNLGVSRHHCTLVREGEQWVVVDAGSNNGTYVGAQRIERHVLRDGDRIVVGKHALLFDQHGVAAATANQPKKPGIALGGGDMTMFVDQAQLAKVLASESGKRIVLAVQQGGREVLMHLTKEETTIGSAADADVRVKGWFVKAVQAKVVRTPLGHRLIAFGGWRAVRLNGNKVQGEAPLNVGDVIEIAGQHFVYRSA